MLTCQSPEEDTYNYTVRNPLNKTKFTRSKHYPSVLTPSKL